MIEQSENSNDCINGSVAYQIFSKWFKKENPGKDHKTIKEFYKSIKENGISIKPNQRTLYSIACKFKLFDAYEIVELD